MRKWGRSLNQVLGLGYVSEIQAATYPRVGDIRETMRISRTEDGMYKPGLGKSSVKMFKSLNMLAEELNRQDIWAGTEVIKGRKSVDNSYTFGKRVRTTTVYTCTPMHRSLREGGVSRWYKLLKNPEILYGHLGLQPLQISSVTNSWKMLAFSE